MVCFQAYTTVVSVLTDSQLMAIASNICMSERERGNINFCRYVPLEVPVQVFGFFCLVYTPNEHTPFGSDKYDILKIGIASCNVVILAAVKAIIQNVCGLLVIFLNFPQPKSCMGLATKSALTKS